jgi:prophage DNA circulation protein
MPISDLAYNDDGSIKNPWRADLQPAQFRNAYFHVDGSVVDSGRRIVMHEFPKKNMGYAEDMGRRMFEFTVRGYCIQYPRDMPGAGMELYRRDYRIARDLLAAELTSGEPGPLLLPTYKGKEIIVVCPRYRLSEEDRFGGYCIFDMTFLEQGVPPREAPPDSRTQLLQKFNEMRQQIINTIATPKATVDA